MFTKFIATFLLLSYTSLLPQAYLANGAVAQKLDYLPFGTERVNVKTGSFDTHFTFTDQEKDAESGLLYYGARYYNPVLGRFLQVDPALFAMDAEMLAKPQYLNGYSDAVNNPLKYTDPDGKRPDETIAGWAVGIVEGIGGTALWAGDTIAHPVRSGQEVQALVQLAFSEVQSISQNPRQAFTEAGQGYGIQAKEFGNWYWNASDYERGKMLGRITEKIGEGYVVGKVAGEVVGNSGSASRNIEISDLQIQAKFKHASDFGVEGNYNKANVAKFKDAVMGHVKNPNTQTIQGTYRGEQAINYLNPKSGLNVVTKPNGNFVTGFKLGVEQLKNVRTKGVLR